MAERCRREEAVVEETALEAKVNQCIEGMPYEEEPVAERGRLGVEGHAGERIGCQEDGDGGSERDERGLVKKIRGECAQKGFQ